VMFTLKNLSSQIIYKRKKILILAILTRDL
jgi:hypothetical protein